MLDIYLVYVKNCGATDGSLLTEKESYILKYQNHFYSFNKKKKNSIRKKISSFRLIIAREIINCLVISYF